MMYDNREYLKKLKEEKYKKLKKAYGKEYAKACFKTPLYGNIVKTKTKYEK